MKNRLLGRFLHLAKIISLSSALHLVLFNLIFAQGINVSGRVTEGMHEANVLENRTINVGAGDIDVTLDLNQNLDFQQNPAYN